MDGKLNPSRKRKGPLRQSNEALALALASALSTGTSADAQDASRFARPQLVETTSHEWNTVTTVATEKILQAPRPRVLFNHGPQMQNADQIARIVSDMQAVLSPGTQERGKGEGIYHQDLHDLKLTNARLGNIIADQVHISALLTIVQEGIIPRSKSIEKYLIPEHVPGIKSVPLKQVDGKRKFCQATEYMMNGILYETTARHCLDNTEVGATFLNFPWLDDSVRAIQKKQMSGTLELLPDVTDETVDGKIGFLKFINRFGKPESFHTVMNKFSSPVINILFPNPEPAFKRELENGFWFVMPRDLADEILPGAKGNFKGISGCMPFAYVPSKNAFVMTGTFHSVRTALYTNPETNEQTLIGMSAGPDIQRTLTNAYEARRSLLSAVSKTQSGPQVPTPVLEKRPPKTDQH